MCCGSCWRRRRSRWACSGFDLAGPSNTMGAPSFAQFAKGGSLRVFVSQKSETLVPAALLPALAKGARTGYPLFSWRSQTCLKGGPPAGPPRRQSAEILRPAKDAGLRMTALAASIPHPSNIAKGGPPAGKGRSRIRPGLPSGASMPPLRGCTLVGDDGAVRDCRTREVGSEVLWSASNLYKWVLPGSDWHS